jgi:acetyl-CoA C-acetyltransferase
MKRDAVIVSAVRTAIGGQGSALASVPAHIYFHTTNCNKQ